MVTSTPLQVDIKQVAKLFPEFFESARGGQVEEIVVEDVTEEELVDTTGTWHFEQSTTSEDEIEAVLRSMGQNAHVRFADVDTDEGWL